MTRRTERRAPGVYQEGSGWHVEPAHLGPVWERNPQWDGKDPFEEYILPEITLGWEILRWIKDNLQSDETDFFGSPLPFKPTWEQARFLLWWYAIDETGQFLYRNGVLQRLKGWGKDPIAAVMSAVELVGPCRFAGWTAEDVPDKDLKKGDPVGRGHPRAWIQVAAVSRTQTQNTMTLFHGLFAPHCVERHGIEVTKQLVTAYHGQRKIQSVTSSPATLEGGRPTFIIKNETHHWRANNDGVAMSETIERNAAKAKDAAARALSITNAYEPSEDSVAQLERETWEDEQAGLAIRTRSLYDSIEAPPDAKLQPPRQGDEESITGAERERRIRTYLAAIVKAVRGDSTWLSLETTVDFMLSKRNKPSTSRRFWFNQVVAAEDAWVDPLAVDIAVDPLARANREMTGDTLRGGWLVQPDEPVVMFGDGSKSDDSTGLVLCRLSDGYVFTGGVWQKPTGDRGSGWLAPREAVDGRVQELFGRFNIVAFWFDPSHALDDADSSRYWDGFVDKWMQRYKDRLQLWPVKSGLRSHAVMFDMTSPERHKLFVGGAERFVEELEQVNDIEDFDPAFRHDGHPALVGHMKNARRNPNTRYGTSLMKDGRESTRKIDLAVCAVGARLMRDLIMNTGVEEEDKPAEVWGTRHGARRGRRARR